MSSELANKRARYNKRHGEQCNCLMFLKVPSLLRINSGMRQMAVMARKAGKPLRWIDLGDAVIEDAL